MEKQKSLADWKGFYITWRNLVEKASNHRFSRGRQLAVRYRNTAKHMVKRLEAGVLVCLLLLILLGGCSAGVGVGADCDIFYPEKEWVNADGTSGKFGDPAESREQVTRHGVSMQRNNLPTIGGSN